MSFRRFIICLLVIGVVGGGSSCQFHENKLGCTDQRSLNYDAGATIDDGSCVYSDRWLYNHPDSISMPDAEGQLIIMNESKEKLHLYADKQHLKVIPRRTRQFLVNLPDHADKLELSIYKVNETHQVEAPDPNHLFKRWIVILPQSKKPDDHLKWVISSYASSAGSGKIRFSYPAGYNGAAINYQVDVYLQSRSGAYIASLSPGRAHSLTLDYGVYKFYYHYWSSHSGNAEGTREVGWLESPYQVLNAAHTEETIQIPAYNTLPENTAQLHVVNQLEEPVNLFWQNCLMDDVVLGYENASGLAALSSGHETIYYLEEGTGDVACRSMSGNQITALEGLSLVSGIPTKVILGNDLEQFYCINKRGETMYLAAPDYSGIAIAPHAEKWVKIPDANAVHAFNIDKTYFKQVAVEGQNLIIN